MAECSKALETELPQEQASKSPVGLGCQGLAAVVEPHMDPASNLSDRPTLDEAEVELEHRLQGLQTLGIGRVDRKATSTAGPESGTRQAVRRPWNLAANLRSQDLADTALETDFDVLGAVSNQGRVGLGQHHPHRVDRLAQDVSDQLALADEATRKIVGL